MFDFLSNGIPESGICRSPIESWDSHLTAFYVCKRLRLSVREFFDL